MIKIAVIDDQERYLLNWQLCLEQEAKVQSFFHHRQCFDYYQNNSSELSDLKYIIADRFVPDYDALANDFANDFQKRFPAFKGSILLSSSAHKSGETIGRGFLCSLGKEAMSLNEIEQMIEKSSAASQP